MITKRQFFYDIYHPTNAGHRVMADCLDWLFEVTDRSFLDEEDLTDEQPPLIGNDFALTQLLDRRNGDRIACIDPGGFRTPTRICKWRSWTIMHTARRNFHTTGCTRPIPASTALR